MADLVSTDAKIYLAQYNLSGYHTQAELSYNKELHDNTAFGVTSRTKFPGLKNIELTASGYQDFGTVDNITTINNFGTDTTGWTATDCTLASIAGGQAGNCLEITRTGGVIQYASHTVTGFKIGKMYTLTCYLKSGTSGDEAAIIRIRDSSGDIGMASATSSGSWVQYSAVFVATETSLTIRLCKNTATAGTMLFDTVAISQTSLDTTLHSNISLSSKPLTVCPDGDAEGDRCFFFPSVQGEYSTFESIGDLTPFNLACSGEGEVLARGVILGNCKVKGATAGGTTTSQNLGAVSASQKVYAVLHVLHASGSSPTLDVIIESDDDDAWGAGNTTRITFTQATAVGSEYATPVSGAITDTFWRVSYVIAGTNPVFTFIVGIAIQ